MHTKYILLFKFKLIEINAGKLFFFKTMSAHLVIDWNCILV